MRKLNYAILFIIVSVFFFSCGEKKYLPGLTIEPEKPEPGNKLEIVYNSTGTDLENFTDIDAIVYVYKSDLIKTERVKLGREENTFKGNYAIPGDIYGLLIKFESGEKTDNNNGKGYFVNLYSENGKLLPGTIGGKAISSYTWGCWFSDIERNWKQVLNLFDKEFAANPGIKNEFISNYIRILKEVYKDSSEIKIIAELNELEKVKDPDENVLNVLATEYAKIDESKSTKYENILKEKYPSSEFLQTKLYNRFRTEENETVKKELFSELNSRFPDGDLTKNAFEYMCNYYRDKGEFEKAYDFMKENIENISLYRFYSVALKAITSVNKYEIAEKIAGLGVEKGEEELTFKDYTLENYQTPEDRIQDIKEGTSICCYSLGYALTEQNKNNEAETVLARGLELSEKKDVEQNELYAEVLLKNKKYDLLITVLKDFYKVGKNTAKMKDMFIEAYTEGKGSQEEAEAKYKELINEANETLFAEIKGTEINEPAPAFTLTGIDGKKVSLADFKGKIVIIDFWATWCNPCIMSMPGLQQLDDEYKDSKDVKFLMINAWERKEDIKKSVTDFLKANDYHFNALLDTKNEVIADYKVNGIPTKFIIDREGNIRFKLVGYEGTVEKMIEKLKLIISYLE